MTIFSKILDGRCDGWAVMVIEVGVVVSLGKKRGNLVLQFSVVGEERGGPVERACSKPLYRRYRHHDLDDYFSSSFQFVLEFLAGLLVVGQYYREASSQAVLRKTERSP